MEIEVGVITCPRDEPTLDDTLRSIDVAGFVSGFVSIDDDCHWHCGDGWLGIRGVFGGCYRNWRHCAQSLLDCAELGTTHFLICEDDIEVSKNLRNYLERTELPEGVISLYTGAVNHHETKGWHQVTDVPKKCHGALATLWTPELLRDFLYFDKDSEFKHGTDHRMGMFCKLNKVPFWCHSPSFVRHTGKTSAINPHWDEAQQEFRQCKAFLEDASVL
jgi:hypothetical protein